MCGFDSRRVHKINHATLTTELALTRKEGAMHARTSSLTDSLNPAAIRFKNRSEFWADLKKAVDAHFAATQLSRQDVPAQYVKAFTFLTWLTASYILLVFFATTWWQASILSVSLGLAMAGVGFSIQHDGNHQAFSKNKWVNRFMGATLDLIGGSSYFWDRKHENHHVVTNINEHDDDIALGILGRLAPSQRHYWFHRAQHIYLWFLYGFLVPKWQFVDDFVAYARKKIGNHPVKRPKGFEFWLFIGGKILFFSLAFGIPLLLHPLPYVLLTYACTSWCMGVVIAVVFQLAHVVEGSTFPLPTSANGDMENPWAEHQLITTFNFAMKSKVLTYYLGGLNYQIEHHLFRKISHVNYPQVSELVEAKCREHGLPYNNEHKTLWQAIHAHYILLWQLGQPS